MEEMVRLTRLNFSDDEVRDKKRWGRLLKAKGDYSLLAGSPLDALEQYNAGPQPTWPAPPATWYGAAPRLRGRPAPACCAPCRPTSSSAAWCQAAWPPPPRPPLQPPTAAGSGPALAAWLSPWRVLG
ncbi:hypothetical protein V8C86DRAFT_2461569 [Haematococcus lacustris]